MPLENATYITELNPANPTSGDPKSQGDDQIRKIKYVVKSTLPNLAGAVLATHIELNRLVGVTAPIQDQFATKGAIAGQVWTGTHDYTGGVLRAAAPVGANDVVTKAFAESLSFNSALPSQTGNAGKIVATDGTTPSWVERTLDSAFALVKDALDATKRLRFDISGFTSGFTRTLTVQDKNGTIALLADIDDKALLKKKYHDNGASGAINMANGGHQRWAPTTGAQVFTITGLGVANEHHELHLIGIGLGSASSINWSASINWVKPDRSYTTNFTSAGYVLKTGTGIDHIVFWSDNAGTIYGKPI